MPPLQYSSYYLINLYSIFATLDPIKGRTVWGYSSSALTWLCALSSVALKPGPYSFALHGDSNSSFFSRSSYPWILKSHLCLPDQPLASSNFVNQNQLESGFFSVFCVSVRVLEQFCGLINTIQAALDQTYNILSPCSCLDFTQWQAVTWKYSHINLFLLQVALSLSALS